MSLAATIEQLERRFHERFLRWSRKGDGELTAEARAQCDAAVREMEAVAAIADKEGVKVLLRECGRRAEEVKGLLLHVDPVRLRSAGTAQLKGVGIGYEAAGKLVEEIIARGQQARLLLARDQIAKAESKTRQRVERV